MPINETNRDSSLAFVSNEYTSVLFKEIGAADSTYLDVPGITDWSISGTTTPTRDVVDARGPTQKRSGHLRIPEVSVSSLYLPQDRAWRRLKEAQENGDLLSFRIETNGVEVWSTVTADTDLATKGLVFTCTDKGVVTIAKQTGTDAEAVPTIEQAVVGRGAVIQTKAAGNTPAPKNYVIDAITTAATTLNSGITVKDAATFDDPTAVTGTSRLLSKVFNPPNLRLEFVATVTQGADMSLPLDAEMTTELMLQPRSQLPDWVIF